MSVLFLLNNLQALPVTYAGAALALAIRLGVQVLAWGRPRAA